LDTRNRTEKALILAEIYLHNSQWKFRFVGQGFNGGLKPLAENFGVVIADESEKTLHLHLHLLPTPTPTPTNTNSNINLSKIRLDKNNSTINLSKKGNGFGKISVNLNWNKATQIPIIFSKTNGFKCNRSGFGAMVQLKMVKLI
jgi:tellurite resistance protein TerA